MITFSNEHLNKSISNFTLGWCDYLFNNCWILVTITIDIQKNRKTYSFVYVFYKLVAKFALLVKSHHSHVSHSMYEIIQAKSRICVWGTNLHIMTWANHIVCSALFKWHLTISKTYLLGAKTVKCIRMTFLPDKKPVRSIFICIVVNGRLFRKAKFRSQYTFCWRVLLCGNKIMTFFYRPCLWTMYRVMRSRTQMPNILIQCLIYYWPHRRSWFMLWMIFLTCRLLLKSVVFVWILFFGSCCKWTCRLEQ